MKLIRVDDLASLLGMPAGALNDDARANLIVTHTNGLITEKWKKPIDPAPTSVTLLALAVASRAWGNTPGRAPLQSITRSVDDSSRTERFAVSDSTAAGYGVYLSDTELAQLNPRRRTRTRRVVVPGGRYW